LDVKATEAEVFSAVEEFSVRLTDPFKGRKSFFEDCLLQGPPPIGMGRPAGRIVPEGPEVRELFGGVASGPQL